MTYSYSKLIDDASAMEIYCAFKGGTSKSSLGRQFNVDPKTITRIIEKIELEEEKEDFDDVDSTYPDSGDYEDTSDDDGELAPSDNLTTKYNFVLTTNTISITRVVNDSNGFTVESNQESITEGSKNFQEVFDMIMSTRGDQVTLEKCFEIMSTKIRTEKFFRGRLTIDPAREEAKYKTESGQEVDVPASLAITMFEKLKQREDSGFDALCNFTDRLFNNPSFRAVQQLFGFIKAKCIEIDPEGYLICYKKVRSTYMDIHSNTFDNSPGKPVSIDRNQVDEDPERTCSKGLHVCSSSYLPKFGSNNPSTDRIVRVQVDPKDFVAIPKDYNEAKARVCAYYVIDDVTDQF